MTTLEKTAHLSASLPVPGFFKAFIDEVTVVIKALMSPRTIIEEVEQMRALQIEADRIEAADPARATALRRQAARIGLR